MPTTLTSTLVNSVLTGTKTLPIVPGRVCAATVSFNPNGGTVTIGQVIQMVPIPSGCEIIDLFTIANFPLTAGPYTVGDGSLTNRFITSGASLTANSKIVRLNGALGYKYSVSDDVQNPLSRFDTIDLSIGAGATQTFTGSVLMTVYYRYIGQSD